MIYQGHMVKKHKEPNGCDQAVFIPTTMEEVRQRGWDELDIILVTGSTFCVADLLAIY